MKTSTPTRVLLVADWTVDPHAVVASASRRAHERHTEFGLLVPAWLHGMAWVGDPLASVPCAQRQLEAVRALLADAGIPLGKAAVGDPEPATAILDVLEDWPADEVVLCTRPRHLPASPLDVAHRARRLTGLPVERVFVRRRKQSARCVANAADGFPDSSEGGMT